MQAAGLITTAQGGPTMVLDVIDTSQILGGILTQVWEVWDMNGVGVAGGTRGE